MSDIEPRPWKVVRDDSDRYPYTYVTDNGGAFVIGDDSAVGDKRRLIEMIVACVNACAAAGLTPAALAADPEAVKKLVEAARSVLSDAISACECHEPQTRGAYRIHNESAKRFADALRACGIEVGP